MANDRYNLSLMIVDDRPENLASMEQLLAQDGLDIVTAQSGNEALAKMLSLDLALVLLDVQMPGMDGFEVAELMKRNPRTRDFPIIFVTAINKERRHIFSGFEVGAVDYIFKPVDPFIIRSKVRVFLEIKRHQLAREQLLDELNQANHRLREISNRKSDFLSAASHELRTPLTVIKEYCSLVRDGIVGPASEEQKRCMGVALRNCNRLADLVNGLLDLDSIESGYSALYREKLDVARLLEQVAADFIPRFAGEKQKIVLEGLDQLPPALGNADLVTQVLVNLIGNAHKFTPAGGVITLCAYTDRNNHLCIEVQDTGPGIAEEDQHKVFEKFTQLSRKDGPGPKGTGLGLAISAKICELLGGQLNVESQPGQGSTFRFTLPLYSIKAHMQAFILDGTVQDQAMKSDWSLLLLRFADQRSSLPTWFEDRVAGVLRREDDSSTVVHLDGAQLKAVLLKTDGQGTEAFLDRLCESLANDEIGPDGIEFFIKPLGREHRQELHWPPVELAFSKLNKISDSKGLSYV